MRGRFNGGAIDCTEGRWMKKIEGITELMDSCCSSRNVTMKVMEEWKGHLGDAKRYHSESSDDTAKKNAAKAKRLLTSVGKAILRKYKKYGLKMDVKVNPESDWHEVLLIVTVSYEDDGDVDFEVSYTAMDNMDLDGHYFAIEVPEDDFSYEGEMSDKAATLTKRILPVFTKHFF